MTLIFSYREPLLGMLGSDIIISRPGGAGGVVSLPTIGSYAAKFETSHGSIHSLMLKSIRYARDGVLLWSSNSIPAARLICEQIVGRVTNRSYLGLLDAINGSNELRDAASEVSIMHCRIPIVQFTIAGCTVEYLNCDAHVSNDTEIIKAGSGGWDFFDQHEPTRKGVAGPISFQTTFVNNIMSRVGKMMFLEKYSGDNLHSFYGGWIDTFLYTPFGYARHNYLVALWQMADNDLRRGATYFSSNLESGLCIYAVDVPYTWQRPTEFYVKPLIDCGYRDEFMNGRFDIMVQVHVVISEDFSEMYCFIQNARSDACSIKFDKDNRVFVNSASTFKEYVMRAINSDTPLPPYLSGVAS